MTKARHQFARWTEQSLDTWEKPKRVYEYFVTGTGQFPFDMLRYDAAWPAGSEDASNMGLGFHEAYNGRRTVKLRSYREPTVDRWSSFTWSVGAYPQQPGE